MPDSALFFLLLIVKCYKSFLSVTQSVVAEGVVHVRMLAPPTISSAKVAIIFEKNNSQASMLLSLFVILTIFCISHLFFVRFCPKNLLNLQKHAIFAVFYLTNTLPK